MSSERKIASQLRKKVPLVLDAILLPHMVKEGENSFTTTKYH